MKIRLFNSGGYYGLEEVIFPLDLDVPDDCVIEGLILVPGQTLIDISEHPEVWVAEATYAWLRPSQAEVIHEG